MEPRWLVLLISIIGLLLHQDLSLDHLAAPGAGTLAILQSLIGHKQRSNKIVILISETSEQDDDGKSELDTGADDQG
jgi:hypothetical protein